MQNIGIGDCIFSNMYYTIDNILTWVKKTAGVGSTHGFCTRDCPLKGATHLFLQV